MSAGDDCIVLMKNLSIAKALETYVYLNAFFPYLLKNLKSLSSVIWDFFYNPYIYFLHSPVVESLFHFNSHTTMQCMAVSVLFRYSLNTV